MPLISSSVWLQLVIDILGLMFDIFLLLYVIIMVCHEYVSWFPGWMSQPCYCYTICELYSRVLAATEETSSRWLGQWWDRYLEWSRARPAWGAQSTQCKYSLLSMECKRLTIGLGWSGNIILLVRITVVNLQASIFITYLLFVLILASAEALFTAHGTFEHSTDSQLSSYSVLEW